MSKLCPCCSKKPYENCCMPLLSGNKLAVTAEQLMRSRYSAYAVKNAQYIFDTYAKSTQKVQSVADIQAWANECTWVELTILPYGTESEKEDKDEGTIINITSESKSFENKNTSVKSTVTFSAFYINKNILNRFAETSRFIKEYIAGDFVWRYLDGSVTEHVELTTLSRNSLCPCFENKQLKKKKKFKNCCDQ